MPLQSFGTLLHHPAVQALVAAAGDVETHLVGGVLRDRALGLPLKDIDAVVASRGREIAERLAETLPARLVLLGGKEFAAYRLVAEDLDVDLWDRDGTTLHQDLARRDFTVNSFALERRGTGCVDRSLRRVRDLERRLLKATTPESFSGDPLRVLRLPRLLLRLPGFAADPDTVGLARRSVSRLTDVAAERVRDELTFILEHPEAHRALALLIALDVYPGLWLGRPGEHLRDGDGALGGRRLCARGSTTSASRTPRPPTGSTAASPGWRPCSATSRSCGGPRRREALVRFRDAGYLTRQTADDVALVLELDALPQEELDLRRFLHRAGRLWPTAFCALGARMAAREEGWTAGGPCCRGSRTSPAARARPCSIRRAWSPARTSSRCSGFHRGGRSAGCSTPSAQAQVEGRVRTREEAVEVVPASLPEDPRLPLRLAAASAAAAAHDALVELLDALHQLVDLLLGFLAQAGVVAAQLLAVRGHLLEAPAQLLRLEVALADGVMKSGDLERPSRPSSA